MKFFKSFNPTLDSILFLKKLNCNTYFCRRDDIMQILNSDFFTAKKSENIRALNLSEIILRT